MAASAARVAVEDAPGRGPAGDAIADRRGVYGPAGDSAGRPSQPPHAAGPVAPIAGPAGTPAARAKDALHLQVDVHDHEQIDLQLRQPATDHRDGDSTDLELYFFVPRNVGVNATNYHRDDFYADLTSFVRIDLPPLSLSDIAAGVLDSSPLRDLDRHLSALAAGGADTGPVGVQVKLFGHSFTEAIRAGTAALQEQIDHLPPGDGAARRALCTQAEAFCAGARAALALLRQARWAFEPFRRAAPAVERVFRQTDEYSSLFFDGALASLWHRVADTPHLFDGSGLGPGLHRILMQAARDEASYRRQRGYLNLDSPDPAAGEYFTYRQSLLKKAVQQALYIDTRRLPTDRYVRNATGMVAAGLAATWAVASQLPLTLQGLSPSMQLAVLVVPVIAYVAKDRIKELTREWLTGRMQAFDHDTALSAETLSEAGLSPISGRLRERLRFLNVDEVPPQVVQTRMARRTIEGTDLSGESVLCYHRRLEIDPPKGPDATATRDGGRPAPHPSSRHGTRQILRINLRHFLVRLDEPELRSEHFLPHENRFGSLPLAKVYHLSLVARVTHAGRTQLSRYRIVLNKRGIVRLERIDLPSTDAGPAIGPPA